MRLDREHVCDSCGGLGAVPVRGADTLCLDCRLARSRARVEWSRALADLPPEEPLPVATDWRACALNPGDWLDPFDDV